ncbi:MAG TPA: pyridoxal-phosphate dependent enzyme [Streptosporangiaceae bacterium]|nr:pyridoxal-phosphate dependent enzyme [Streptosporangiaceae bacterium]
MAPSPGARIPAGADLAGPAAPGAAPPESAAAVSATAGSLLAAAASALARPLLAAADALPRTRLAVLPTPLVPAPRLAEALGASSLLVKRDDLTGFAFGGNKARLLEFLVAGALADGADTLLTGGAASSNFCAATAAAARRAGLRCELVIAGQPGPGEPGPAGPGPAASGPAGPALALARSWGAAVRWTGTPDRDSVDAQLPAAAADLAARGYRPYLIPRGGATGLGAVGYALAAAELQEQLAGHGTGRGDVTVVVPTGSGGTLAGLLAGHALLGRPWALTGGSASRPPPAIVPRVLSLAGQCLRLLGADQEPSPDDVTVVDARGPGHGLPSPAGLAAAEQAMRTEGLMLDPVYTAKALALVPRGRDVVFWHTGGVLDTVAAAEGRP